MGHRHDDFECGLVTSPALYVRAVMVCQSTQPNDCQGRSLEAATTTQDLVGATVDGVTSFLNYVQSQYNTI